MADTQRTGAEIALSSVGHIDEINRQRLEAELVREKLQLEIEQVRLQIAQVKQQEMITEYNTQLIFNALADTPVYSNIEALIRMNLTEALGKNFINSLHAQYLPIRNQTEAQTPDAETTAEEVPDQNTTNAPTSEAVEAPTENKAQPTKGGSSQSQGK